MRAFLRSVVVFVPELTRIVPSSSFTMVVSISCRLYAQIGGQDRIARWVPWWERAAGDDFERER